MPTSAEVFTLLAVVEAQDAATNILTGIIGTFTTLGTTITAAMAETEAAMAAYDASIYASMGVTDAMVMAEHRLTSAEMELAAAGRSVVASQMALDAAIITGDMEAAAEASSALAAAEARAAAATRDLAVKQGELEVVQGRAGAKAAEGAAIMGGLESAAIKTSAGIMVAAGAAAHMAGNFEQETQILVAGAGEQQSALAGVRQDMLKLAVDTGTSTKQIADGYFLVESRGFHAKEALEVMTTAAKMAKVHNAELGTVAKATADTLNSYGEGADKAAEVSNILGVAVERGGMSFQELASSLSTVTPIAATMHIPLEQVAGALATMTQQGMSTRQAAQDLQHAMEKLNSPTLAMVSTWNQVGLSQKQVADTLHGPGGMAAAMKMIDDAVRAHLGPAGQVVIDTFKQSQDATKALNMMFQNMNPQLQSLTKRFQEGTVSQKDYRDQARRMSEDNAAQATQFLNLSNKANGFNDAVKAGKPGFSNYDDLLKAMYGDQTSLNTALLLGGTHATRWAEIAEEAGAAGKNATGEIKGWNEVQGTLNQKMAEAKASLEKFGITLGTAVLPLVTQFLKDITPIIGAIGDFIGKHEKLVGLLVSMAGGLLIAAGAMKAWAAAAAIAEFIVPILTGEMTALDAAMDANPIGLLVLAIGALVAGVIYAFNHFKWFHDLVMGSWILIKTAGIATWHALEVAFHAVAVAAVWVYQNGILPLWHGMVIAFNAIKGAASAVWSFLKSVFNGLVNFLTGVWNSIANTATAVWNSISAFFKKWWPLLLVIFATPIAVLVSLWNHFHDDVANAAKVAWNAVKDFFVYIWNWLKDTAKSAWELMKTYVIQPTEAMWHELVHIWEVVKSAAAAAWHWLGGVTKSAWELIKTYVIQPFQAMWNWLMGATSGIRKTIVDGFNDVVNFLKGIGHWFVDVGEGIVNGIIKGVRNSWHWLTNEVKDLANDALRAAKSFLGISSPSKVFADSVGKWIPHGVAAGVASHAHEAVNAVRDMAGQLPQAIGVKGAVNIGVNGLNTAGTVMATGLGLSPSSMVQNQGGSVMAVTIDLKNAVVAGDHGIKQLTDKIGSVLATKMLPQAGVRIGRF